MRTVFKGRTQATDERLGGCGFPDCHELAVCANCVQCAEHHDVTYLAGHCGFADPMPVKFDPPDPRAAVQMIVVEDNDVRANTEKTDA